MDPDGVRLFGEDGKAMVAMRRPRGKDLESGVCRVSKGSWGGSSPTALTPVVSRVFGKMQSNAQGTNEQGEL